MNHRLEPEEIEKLTKLSEKRRELGRRLLVIHRQAMKVIGFDPDQASEMFPDEDFHKFNDYGAVCPEYDWEENKQFPIYVDFGERKLRQWEIMEAESQAAILKEELKKGWMCEDDD